MEQYARHGCEAWAREGRSSSGSGACAVRPRGEAAPHVLAGTYASRPRRPGVRSLGATRPAQSGRGGRLGARGIGIAHSVFFPSGGGLSQAWWGVATHSFRGGQEHLADARLDRARKDESDLRGRRVRWMSKCASPRTVS